MTNAEALHRISRLSRTLAAAVTSLAEGAWNPDFCSADSSAFVLSVTEDLKAQIEHIEKRIAEKA